MLEIARAFARIGYFGAGFCAAYPVADPSTLQIALVGAIGFTTLALLSEIFVGVWRKL